MKVAIDLTQDSEDEESDTRAINPCVTNTTRRVPGSNPTHSLHGSLHLQRPYEGIQSYPSIPFVAEPQAIDLSLRSHNRNPGPAVNPFLKPNRGAIPTNRTVFKCKHCQYSSFDRRQIVIHCSSFHQRERSMLSAQRLGNSNEQNKTSQQRIANQLYCNYCQYVTDSEYCILHHLLYNHREAVLPINVGSGTANQFKCPYCNFMSGQDYMAQHMLRHYAHVPICGKCRECYGLPDRTSNETEPQLPAAKTNAPQSQSQDVNVSTKKVTNKTKIQKAPTISREITPAASKEVGTHENPSMLSSDTIVNTETSVHTENVSTELDSNAESSSASGIEHSYSNMKPTQKSPQKKSKPAAETGSQTSVKVNGKACNKKPPAVLNKYDTSAKNFISKIFKEYSENLQKIEKSKQSKEQHALTISRSQQSCNQPDIESSSTSGKIIITTSASSNSDNSLQSTQSLRHLQLAKRGKKQAMGKPATVTADLSGDDNTLVQDPVTVNKSTLTKADNRNSVMDTVTVHKSPLSTPVSCNPVQDPVTEACSPVKDTVTVHKSSLSTPDSCNPVQDPVTVTVNKSTLSIAEACNYVQLHTVAVHKSSLASPDGCSPIKDRGTIYKSSSPISDASVPVQDIVTVNKSPLSLAEACSSAMDTVTAHKSQRSIPVACSQVKDTVLVNKSPMCTPETCVPVNSTVNVYNSSLSISDTCSSAVASVEEPATEDSQEAIGSVDTQQDHAVTVSNVTTKDLVDSQGDVDISNRTKQVANLLRNKLSSLKPRLRPTLSSESASSSSESVSSTASDNRKRHSSTHSESGGEDIPPLKQLRVVLTDSETIKAHSVESEDSSTIPGSNSEEKSPSNESCKIKLVKSGKGTYYVQNKQTAELLNSTAAALQNDNGLKASNDDLCNVSPSSRVSSNDSGIDVALDDEMLVICPLCPKSLILRLLPAHMQFHEILGDLKCPMCTFSSAYKWVLESHIPCHKEASAVQADGELIKITLEQWKMLKKTRFKHESKDVRNAQKLLYKPINTDNTSSVPQHCVARKSSNRKKQPQAKTNATVHQSGKCEINFASIPVDKSTAVSTEDFLSKMISDKRMMM